MSIIVYEVYDPRTNKLLFASIVLDAAQNYATAFQKKTRFIPNIFTYEHDPKQHSFKDVVSNRKGDILFETAWKKHVASKIEKNIPGYSHT
jgi:hypothetical protein